MNEDGGDLRKTIARHEREIDVLQRQMDELRTGHARQQLESELARKMAELDADIRLQEMQEEMAKEEAEKQRKHRWPWG